MPLNIVSVLPDVNASGVILQGAVIVTFDQEIDVTTYSESSFLLSAPPESPVVPPGSLVGAVSPVTGTDYVAGTFSFALNTAGHTIATFRPARPMRPNVKYTVLISTDVATAAGVHPGEQLQLELRHRRSEPDDSPAAAARSAQGRPDPTGEHFLGLGAYSASNSASTEFDTKFSY